MNILSTYLTNQFIIELDLLDRISSINLNDTESLWNAMNEEEKQGFKSFVKSGNVDEILEKFEPFWCENTKIQTMNSFKNLQKEYDRNTNHIKPFNEITSKTPSPSVLYNIHNVVAAFAFTYRFFSGDVLEYSDESSTVFLSICCCLSKNLNFDSEISAIQSVLHECNENNLHVEKKLIENDVAKIFQGTSNQIFYLILVLGNTRKLLKTCLSNSKTNFDSGSNFCKDFPEIVHKEIDREKYKNHVKKIDYYLSFVKFKLTDSNNKNLLN